MSKSLVPKYTWWETANAALSIGMRALEEIRTLARTPGPPGKDGRDGFGFEDLEVTYDGERTFSFKFERASNVKEFVFKLPVVIYRGAYKLGQQYEKGDSVSYGGHTWIAKVDTIAKPEMDGGPWQLSNKKGRDGKDGGTPPSTPRGPVKVG